MLMPLAWWADAVNRTATYNLSTGIVTQVQGGTATATMVPVGGGWYRASLTATPDLSASGAVRFAGASAVGDGVSVQHYAFGAQLEAGAFATSYIPTTAAAVTRSADVATMPWSGTAAVTLDSEYIVPYATLPAGSGHVSVQIDDGTTNNLYAVRQINVSGMVTSVFASNANVITGGAGGPFTANAVMKHAAAFDTVARTGSMVANGAAPVSLTFSATPAATTRLMVGSGRVTAINGWMQRIRYWPRALTNAELQQVTT